MAARRIATLADARLRRLERRLDQADRRLYDLRAELDQATEVLTRLVRVVAVQSRQSRKVLDRLDDRLRRVSRDVTTARTADVRRLGALERRLTMLEARRSS